MDKILSVSAYVQDPALKFHVGYKYSLKGQIKQFWFSFGLTDGNLRI